MRRSARRAPYDADVGNDPGGKGIAGIPGLLHKEEVTDGCITDHTIRIIQHMEKLIEMAESEKKAIENEEDINR